MDVELFSDTGCIDAKEEYPPEYMMDGLDRYVALLQKNGIKPTLFLMQKAAECFPEKIKEYIARGYDIALHGQSHVAPDTVSAEEFRESIRESKQYLEEKFGIRVDGYRAPFFHMNPEKIGILKELGFRYDASNLRYGDLCGQGNFDRVGRQMMTDGEICEYNLVMQKVAGTPYHISGGGCVRVGSPLLFYPIFHRYIRKNDYYTFYLHPFELSEAGVPKRRRSKFYEQIYFCKGRKRYAEKIQYIIDSLKKQGFAFYTMKEITDQLLSIKGQGK